jgi:hypothetical protein
MLLAGLIALSSLMLVPLQARASSGLRVLRYRSFRVMVPAGWPVFDLAAHPRVCVRFNRHAVYLGRPGDDQLCPGHVAGRTEAILIEPAGSGTSSVDSLPRILPAPSLPAADASQGTEAQIVDRAHGVAIIATWSRQPAVIAQALGLRSMRAAAMHSRVRPPVAGLARPVSRHTAMARMTSASAPGQVYTGQAFDACAAPSSSQMSSWSSAYRALGVYIGGVNMGCSQANLTASWVGHQSAAGWHLIPIYVGLQAPGNRCGCASISAGSASSQGQAAASDAVAQAQAIGLGRGNPIYYDMEGYSQGGNTSSAVLTFLSAWTQQLHSAGYKSGVYSSDDSGISDLASKWGTGYSEPDDLWSAAWNGQANTLDANVPGNEWANHQRVHQYAGNENQTHGGVTINIDSDYVDGATAAAGSTSVSAPPSNSSPPSISGPALEGQTLNERRGSWSGSPSSYSYRWEDCDGSGNRCSQIAGARNSSYTLSASDLGHTIRVVETAANGAGSAAATSAPTALVRAPASYWVFSRQGNVYGSFGAVWYGSPYASAGGSAGVAANGGGTVGMAGTADGKGYWLITASGRVYSYGDAAPQTAVPSPAHPIIGIVASPTGGYWIYSAYGNVYSTLGAGWYGSPNSSSPGESHITGMTATPDGKGYWLVTSSGRVYSYGDAARQTAVPSPAHPIIGIVASATGGYWIYSAYGNLYSTLGAGWYGSPNSSSPGESHITGMTATPDGKGYRLVNSSGRVYSYGDAPSLATGLSPGHPPITGIAG